MLTGGGYAKFATKYIHYRDAEVATMEGVEQSYKDESWYLKLFYDPRPHWKELSTRGPSRKE